MSNVAKEIAEIEKELLALTGDQPPNPADIVTCKVTRVTTVNDEIKTIVWADGVPKFVNIYVTAGSGNASILVSGADLKVYVSGNAPVTYVGVSLGEFSFV